MTPEFTSLPPGAARYEPPEGSRPAPHSALADAIRDAALRLGFARVGFCPVEPFEQAGKSLSRWLEHGRHGQMGYLTKPPRHDPAPLLPAARSLIVVAMAHPRGGQPPRAPQPSLPLAGQIARYARGSDYHEVLKLRLRELARACAGLIGRTLIARACVDTAPLLEREAARRAGVAFTGKSTLSILPGFGTYALLGELLVDVELPAATPLADQCGRCTACLDACPTGAFVDAHVLDARRCISYLTIELRGWIPRPLRAGIGRWVFGCDVCQEVCPFNHSRRPRASAPELSARDALSDPSLVDLLELTASGYRRLVRGTALRRASRRQLQRNAAVALGNGGSPSALGPLQQAAQHNPNAVVRGHAAWALGRLGGPAARQALENLLPAEPDPEVGEEIVAALSELA